MNLKKAADDSLVFLENKRKMKWVDKNSGHYCFMLCARSLYITWGANVHWDWNCFKETDEYNIEVAKLSHVCWLDVRGKFDVSELSPGVDYEVVYVVKLTKGASGWELPINLRLSLPNGEIRERQAIFLDKPRKEWIEINVGKFKANDGEKGEVCFDMYEHGGHWKNGLIVKGAILRPNLSFHTVESNHCLPQLMGRDAYLASGASCRAN